VKPNAGDRVRTRSGLEGEVLFIDREHGIASVELEDTDGKIKIDRLDELTWIVTGDKKRKC
jgi:preprotein translocase subunit YajC